MNDPVMPAIPVMSSPPQSIRLLIIDDHAVVREGLEAMLGVDPCFNEIATAASTEDGVQLCGGFHPDVILLDLRMPESDGFSALEIIHRRWPEIRILVLSAGATAADPDIGVLAEVFRTRPGSTVSTTRRDASRRDATSRRR